MTYYSRRFQYDKSRYPRCPDQSIQDLQYRREARHSRNPHTYTGRPESVPNIAITITGNQRVVHDERGVKRTRPESPYRRRSPPSKRRVCPVRGRGTPVGKLKLQLGLFHDEETPAELANSQRHALEMMARFLFGKDGAVEDLMHLVNEESDIKNPIPSKPWKL